MEIAFFSWKERKKHCERSVRHTPTLSVTKKSRQLYKKWFQLLWTSKVDDRNIYMCICHSLVINKSHALQLSTKIKLNRKWRALNISLLSKKIVSMKKFECGTTGYLIHKLWYMRELLPILLFASCRNDAFGLKTLSIWAGPGKQFSTSCYPCLKCYGEALTEERHPLKITMIELLF